MKIAEVPIQPLAEGCDVTMLMHCLLEMWVGELDPFQCLIKGIKTFGVSAFCFGALMCADWSIPDVRYSKTAGVMVSAAN